MLRTQIGSSSVVARVGERKLWVLDACSSLLWDLNNSGLDKEEIGYELAKHFHLSFEAALHHFDQHYQTWIEAGLIDDEAIARIAPGEPFQPIPIFPPPNLFQPSPDAWRLTVAQQPIVLYIENPDLRRKIQPMFDGLFCDASTSSAETMSNCVTIAGAPDFWCLNINGDESESGRGWQTALLAILSVLTELGCRTKDRLIVVHGAGLVAPDGLCLLIVAPGGSGKSTLAMALEADGFNLLSDDVTPICADGQALGMGLPACIKKGSWPVLAKFRPEIETATELLRFGRTVRFLPPKNKPMTNSVTPELLIFSKYQHEAKQKCMRIPPEEALQRLVASESVIRDLSQEKLERLCQWISGMPAYVLTYPDIHTGMSLVRSILTRHVG